MRITPVSAGWLLAVAMLVASCGPAAFSVEPATPPPLTVIFSNDLPPNATVVAEPTSLSTATRLPSATHEPSPTATSFPTPPSVISAYLDGVQFTDFTSFDKNASLEGILGGEIASLGEAWQVDVDDESPLAESDIGAELTPGHGWRVVFLSLSGGQRVHFPTGAYPQ